MIMNNFLIWLKYRLIYLWQEFILIFRKPLISVLKFLGILPKDEIFYLGIPYSSDDPAVREERFKKANLATTKLMKMGFVVFSPIGSNHFLAITGGLSCDWSFWEKYDTAFLCRCSKLIVLKLEGWENSIGLSAEIKIAQRLGIPVEYLEKTFIE